MFVRSEELLCPWCPITVGAEKLSLCDKPCSKWHGTAFEKEDSLNNVLSNAPHIT